MQIIVTVHARATGEEKRQCYTFETEHDITCPMDNEQEKLFLFFVQGFIAGAFKRFTNEYSFLSVLDAEYHRPPKYLFERGRIFEIESVDPLGKIIKNGLLSL